LCVANNLIANRLRGYRTRITIAGGTYPDFGWLVAESAWLGHFKGEFMLADKSYCYPLTITDLATRYLICCDALTSRRAEPAFTVFDRAFKDFGLPVLSALTTALRSPARAPSSAYRDSSCGDRA